MLWGVGNRVEIVTCDVTCNVTKLLENDYEALNIENKFLANNQSINILFSTNLNIDSVYTLIFVILILVQANCNNSTVRRDS